jgi:hypothetical protein
MDAVTVLADFTGTAALVLNHQGSKNTKFHQGFLDETWCPLCLGGKETRPPKNKAASSLAADD